METKNLTDGWKTCIQDFIKKYADNEELCMKIKILCDGVSNVGHSKVYLLTLKEVLQSRPLPGGDDLFRILASIYLRLNIKNAAKKVLSSFFQGLPEQQKDVARELLCQETRSACTSLLIDDGAHHPTPREIVDSLTALMDNFQLVVVFLSAAQNYFLKLFRQPEQSAKQLNSIMHDCHVTMQALNRLLQRHPPAIEDIAQLKISVLKQIMENDIQILVDDLMMVDCRSCCAINMVLLLQMYSPDSLPKIIATIFAKLENLGLSPWLENVGFQHLRVVSLSAMAALSLLWGFLSMLSAETLLMEVVAGETVLVCDAMLQTLLSLDELCISSSCRVQCIKTITLWSTRMCTLKDDLQARENVLKKLSGTSCTIQGLLGYVWVHWQDQMDVVRQNCRVIFDNCLKLHILAVNCVDPQADGFLLDLVDLVLKQSWSSPGKFAALNSLVVLLGCCSFILRQPDFPTILVSQMQDQGIACHASELLDTCIQSSKALHSQMKEIPSESWLQVWVDPVVDALCGINQKLKMHILEYLLPKIMRKDIMVLEYILSKLAATKGGEDNSGHLGAFIMCLRRARAVGMMPQTFSIHRDGSESIWDRLYHALCSHDEQVRLEAFAFLCENKRTSEILTEKEFEHIRLFIAHNLNKQSPAFRQSMLSLIRKLFFRISESYLTLLKQKKKRHKSHEDLEVTLASYYSFLSWLEDFLFGQLYPTAAFARRTISLAMLVLMVQEIHTDKNLGFWPLGNVTLNHLQTLLECLTDTFEENKREAFALLVTITARNQDLLTVEHCKALYSAALELAVSIRPQDCATAAYLFRFLLQQGKIKALIKSHRLCLQRPLTLSKKILDILSETDTSFGTRQNSLCHTLEPECTDPDNDHQFDQNQHEMGTVGVSEIHKTGTVGGSEIHETGTVGGSEMEIKSLGELSLFSQYPSQPQHGDQSQCQVKNEQTASFQGIDVDEMWCVKDGDIPVTVQLLKVLLLLLMDQACVADSSLVMAAANRPMYPTLHCIRCLLNDVDFGLVEECHKVVWAKYISCLLHICLHIAEVVSPVVQNSSPEGNVPKEAIIGSGLNFDTGLMAELEESQQMVTLMPEYLVVCCWRSIKEVSLLLGHLSLYLPVTQPGICLGMLTLQQVELIGLYFKQQLMESLHRGAFELAYAGFVLMCQMLWKNPWKQLQTLPQLWLEKVMTTITGDKPSSHLCATRRSAGVPFFIQAIVATESSTSGRPCFHRAVKQLLCIALTTTSEESTFKTDSQVHSMNILRTLFRDTRLGEDVSPYIADGLKVAILGFKSQYWEIRNSATLLLSALMTRIFGVKRSKDESLLSKRNSQTGRAFFHKYPDLYQFLLSELESATQDFGSGGHIHLHPSLYPVLMILSHLFLSTMEGSATRFHLSAFVPFVIRCAGSPVYKTRMMAARALQSLVHKEQLASTLASLLQQLPCHSRCSHLQYSHSHVHGLLLQIHYLLLLIPDLNTSLFLVLLKVFSRTWLDHTWLFTRSNPCALTRKLALDITDLILSSIISFGMLTDSTELLNMQSIAGSLLSVLQVELNKDALCYYSSHTPFLPDFLSCLASLAVKYFAVKSDSALESEKLILQLLGFDSYEFRSAFLDSLVTYLHSNRGGKGNNTAHSMDSKGDYLKQGEESGTSCTSVENVACDGDGLLDDPVSLVWTNAVVTELLIMGMQNGGHTEIAVKAFQVLLLVPNVCSYVEEDKSKIFERLLTKLQAEKRTDIKAVIIEFIGHVFLELYNNSHRICLSETLLLVVKWGNILRSLCQEEDSQDLQLSCARTLVLTSAALLEDKDHLMGTSVFDFWGLLILLLQADDLEVKEIAASVTVKLCPVGSGGTHPEQALSCVVKAMLSLYGSDYPLHCVLATLKWLYGHDAIEYKDTEERLFDKGDINTYHDDIAFAKTLSEELSKSFLRTKCTSTELTPNESSGSLQHVRQMPHPVHFHDSSHLPQLMRDTDHQAEQEISVILSKMQSQVLGTEITELNSVFLKTVQFYKDTQLLIIAAVLSRAVEFCNLSLRLNIETQKLLQTVKMAAQRSPVKNLLLRQLLEQKQLS